jgi:hypothetical protein
MQQRDMEEPMIRRWRVQPGMVLAVSQEALAVAVMDAVTMVHRAGGVFQVVCERYPDGAAGRDGDDWCGGGVAAPHGRTAGARARQPDRDAVADGADIRVESGSVHEPPPEDDPTQYKGGEFRDDIGDGIDENALPEEDDSEIPETVG